MRKTPILRAAATAAAEAHASARQPLIKFIGHHHPPAAASTSSTPEPHPASPHAHLPDSFARYREKVAKPGHEPAAELRARTQENAFSAATTSAAAAPAAAFAAQGSKGASAVQSVTDRSELPQRFWRLAWADGEGEAVESGGASLVG